jgi:FtsZ-interacting cell division protein YlmF
MIGGYDVDDFSEEAPNYVHNTQSPIVNVNSPKGRGMDTSIPFTANALSKSMTTSIILFEPVSKDDEIKITDHMKSHKLVIVDFRKVENAVAEDVYYFLCGSACAINYSVEKLAPKMFMFLPESTKLIRAEASTRSAENSFW